MSGSGCHALERAAGPGSVQFGAGCGRIGAAGDEDRVCTPVGVEQAIPVAMIDQGRVETALFGQISLHQLPVAGFRPRCDSLQEVQRLAERAAGGMHCQVDRPAATPALDMVVEPGAVDADRRSPALPARPVAAVPPVAEFLGDPFERNGAQPVGPRGAGGVHGASSRLACSTCVIETVRDPSRAAACRA